MTRIFFLVAVLASGCSSEPGRATEEALAKSDVQASDSGRVECAVEGETAFMRVCTLDRIAGADGTILVLRHPSGGFRRLMTTDDGRGVIAADGADVAAVSVIGGGEIEVALAGDRYRLPATVKATAPPGR